MIKAIISLVLMVLIVAYVIMVLFFEKFLDKIFDGFYYFVILNKKEKIIEKERKTNETYETLNKIDIKVIERYLREKKLKKFK